MVSHKQISEFTAESELGIVGGETPRCSCTTFLSPHQQAIWMFGNSQPDAGVLVVDLFGRLDKHTTFTLGCPQACLSSFHDVDKVISVDASGVYYERCTL